MDLHQLGLRTTVARMREGSLTCEAYTRALLDRIERLEPRIQAWAWLDRDAALEKARAADRRRAAGKPLGPLHGIPVGIKDVIETQGIPTGMGSPAYDGYVPRHSASVAQRIEQAGAFVLGKTVTAELAYYFPGKTRNPWNPAHTPGGSSMGSAAAVAAGMVPAALGTQTNGSVIRPAAFCGCVGYKPSFGLIPRTGILRFSRTLDQVGVFARNVADTAVVAAALVGYDPQDPDSLNQKAPFADSAELEPMNQPPRLAAIRSPVWHYADAAQQELFARNLDDLRAAGARVDEPELPREFDRGHEVLRTIMWYEGARALAPLQARHRAQLSRPLNELIDGGLQIADAVYGEALQERTRLRGELNDLLLRYDALFTPPARGEAPATLEQTGDPAFCTLWTLCGAPAIVLPAGLGPRGLPLGLQLVGGYLRDASLLAAAQWCARVLAFSRLPPEWTGAGGRIVA